MAGGLLGDLLGGGTTDANALDLSRLVRPPDPLGAALAAMAEKFATAGQASRLPVSTLGAIGSALGGASTAANAANTTYLDQAVKLQALKRSIMAMGYDEKFAEVLAQERLRQLKQVAPGAQPAAAAGAPAATPAVPGVPVAPAAAAPQVAAAPAAAPAALDSPLGFGGGDQGAEARLRDPLATPSIGTQGLLGGPGGPDTLLAQGGPAAGVTQASFRPDEATPLVAAANGAANQLDPALLRGLLAGGDDTGLAGGGERDGLLGPPDELIRGPAADLPIRQASMTAPRSEANIISAESGGRPYVGYGGVDLTNAPRDPETGFPQWAGKMGPAGISHAAGLYMFQPGTWAEGARALGIKDFSPESQKAVYDWTRAKSGDAPWQASEGGARPGVMLAQYAGGVPPIVGPGSGQIPGLLGGMSPETIALLNAYAGLAGHGSPFKEFLDIYYKNPQYLQEAARASEAGKSEIATPATMAINAAQAMNTIKTDMAKEGMMIDPKTNQVIQIPGWAGAKARTADELEAVKNKYATKLAETQAGFEPVTVTQKQPDGSLAEITISKAERKRREDMQGNRAPQPGDIVGKPTATLPEGYRWKATPEGGFTAEVIPDTPAAAKAQELQRTRAIADRQLQVARDSVVAAADRIENNVKTSTLPTTGIYGSKLTGVYQPAQDVQADIQNIEARMTLDQLNALRAGSPTGGALGAVSEGEGAKLATAMANLKQSQSKEQFLANLQVVKQAYIDAVHGPGAWKQMSDQPVLKTQPPSREWKENDIVPYPDGSQRQLKNGEWILIKPPIQR